MATLPRLIPTYMAQTLSCVLVTLFLVRPSASKAQEPPVPASELASSEEVPTAEEIAAAIAKLDSDDFVERESTQMTLWKAGAAAEAALEEAARNGTAEARFRAARVLERFQLGIYPDTPPEIVSLVMRFRRGNMDEKAVVIARIAAGGHFEIVRKLVDTVEDEEAAENLARAAAREAERPARALIAQGKLDEAEAILRLSAVTPEAMQNFAAFCVLRGDAERVRKEMEASGMREKSKWESLHWLARASGDFASALDYAEKLEDKELIREARIASGDLVAFAEGAEDLRLRTLKALGFTAAAQRLDGETEAFEKTIGEIVDYAVQHQSEASMIYTVLMANGAVEEALEVVRKANPNLAHAHLLEQERFEEAMEIKGLDGERPPFDKWLAGQVKAFAATEDSEDGRAAMMGLGDFDDVAGFLKLRGEQAYLNRMCSELAAVAEQKSAQTNVLLARYFRGLRALDAFSVCVGRALEAKVGKEELLGDLFGLQAANALRWSEILGETFKAEPAAGILKIDAVLVSDGGKPIPPEVAEMIAAAANAARETDKLEEADKDEQADLHGALAETWMVWGEWDKAVAELRAALEMDGDNEFRLRRLGEILLYRRAWAEAAEVFGKLAGLDGDDDLSVFIQGWLLARAGKVEEGEAMMRLVDLRLLGDTETRGSIEEFLWEAGDVEHAEKQSKLILSLARPYSKASALACFYLSSRLRYTEREDEAALMMERQLLHSMHGLNNYSYLRSPVASVGALYSVKARAALRKEDVEGAMAFAERALAISPGDSALLEYLYPMLVERGHVEKADALFDNVYPVSKNGVALYPEYGQSNNNHAWLLARCGKHLDEALRHAEKAVAIEPRSSASIDTLAEVYFARGDYQKAAETSDRALVFGPGDAQLREQNLRFHQAAEEAK